MSAAETVLHRLDAARQKWWFFTLLTTTVLAACLSLGTFLSFMLADALARLPQAWLAFLFVTWLAVSGALVFLVGRHLVRSQRSLEGTARRVEAELPGLGSHLINLVQLSENHAGGDPGFRQAAIREAAEHVDGASFSAVVGKQSRWRRFQDSTQTPRDLAEALVALALLVAVAAVCQRWLPGWDSAAGRLLTPWQFVPSVGKVDIRVTPDRDSEVMTGGSLEVVAEIANPDDQPYKGSLLVTDGEKQTTLSMLADETHRRYRVTVPGIVAPLAYHLEIADSQTRVYHVTVREKPVVEEVAVAFRYPAYLGRPDETVTLKQPDLEAPQYTQAELRVRASVPIAQGYVQLEGTRLAGRVQEEGRLLVVERLPLLRDGTFTIHLLNDAGHSDPNPRVNRIRVLPDRPPLVELVKPPRESSAAPGGEVAVSVRATDDHGLDRVWLEMKTGETEPQATVQRWTELGGTTAFRQYRLELKADKFRPGQTIFLRALAADRRAVSDWGLDLKPQESATAWQTVKIVPAESQSAAALEQLERLRGAIARILEEQVHARVQAAGILKTEQLADRAALAAEVRRAQVEIQKAALGVAEAIGQAATDEQLTIKRVLNKLAFGEMLEAVRRSDGLLLLKAAGDFTRPTPELLAGQDRIIASLRKLLDVARHAESEMLADMKQRPGGDLPDDARHKLEEARKKLDEFLKQQKKVIEASRDLAKKPVEDYTEEDQQLLKSLAAIEDDWAKFMEDLHTDLSRLPEQDFANSSMARELVEIQTELKMAADALTKKSADVAVPLEQLGYERAEELNTNFEKWLPDSPDREKWSQEESLTDADKEAPMAELPGELEDLVGDLMEKEEDLFDEMEDATSSAADSIDKGAGWDALDGPISNMSAKGVTGNRLPNTSEIGGRAGEGRQGKSSGEFVGDEAIGKGGRNTPSRLTPDPLVKGQIKDHGKQPAGGATGGGKESGQGGEGLEGPTPRSPGPRDLQRLADKQAALHNAAEKIDLQFQVSSFHHADLKKLIEAMAQIERDLRAGRYQNALRQRSVLAEAAGNVKRYLEGEFEVRRDRTANLPADIQKQILGSMQDPSPAGWEEMNREYFERLSEGNEKK